MLRKIEANGVNYLLLLLMHVHLFPTIKICHHIKVEYDNVYFDRRNGYRFLANLTVTI